MQTVALIFHWIGYIVIAIIIQQFFPGVDALLPGFLIALQSEDKPTIFWLFLVFALVQEGCGSLKVGTSILWYGGHIILYKVCERFVVPTGLGGVLLFAVLSGIYGLFVIGFMVAIQDIRVVYPVALKECLTQTLLIPLIWLAFGSLRRRMVKKYATVD